MKDRLNGMRVFAAVVDARSFAAAANRLGMSKSLVSRHVSALEASLSVKLLNRSTRRLSLTEAGALFYEHCARIVQEAELAEQQLSETQAEPAGLVKVTATPAFAVRHVLPALSEFYEQYPKIRVQLSCSNRAAIACLNWVRRASTLVSAWRLTRNRVWWRADSPPTGPCSVPRLPISSNMAHRAGSMT